MAEVLGAVASATQLAVLTMGLLGAVKKIKGGSETLRRYQQQLLEIQVLSESIARNPLLQTPDVDFHTRSILANISENNLEHRLRRGWLSRTCTFLYKDRDLVDFFIILDRQKSSLSLVIENIQSRTLYQIQSDIQAMSSTSPPYEKPATPPDSDNEASPKPRSRHSEPRVMDASPFSCSAQKQTDKPAEASTSHGQADGKMNTPQPPYNVDQNTIRSLDTAMALLERYKGVKGSHYANNIARNGVPLHVGPTVDYSLIKDLKKSIELNSSPDTYVGNVSEGRGKYSIGLKMQYAEGEALDGNSHQPLVYTAYYTDNDGVAVKGDAGAPPGHMEVPEMSLGPSHVRQGASSGAPWPALMRSTVSMADGMIVFGRDSDTTKDHIKTTKDDATT